MEKLGKRFIITILIGLLILVAVYLFLYNTNFISEETMRNIFLFYFVILTIVIGVFIIAYMLLVMKRGFHNIKKCDDELFDIIDAYRKYWSEDKYGYIKQIQIINLYYKDGGKVDELVKNGELKKLYARADFLNVQISLYDNYITCFYSLIISVIASFIFQFMNGTSALLMIVMIIVLLFSFFFIFSLKYYEKGQAGSYRHYICEYEKKLLLQKIQNAQQDIKITEDDEITLYTKQVVLNELIRIRQKSILKKKKDKLERDIHQVEKLDLCLGNYSEFYVRKIRINNSICCLVYDREKGKANNYMGELSLINQEYSNLYQIMERYDLISDYEVKN